MAEQSNKGETPKAVENTSTDDIILPTLEKWQVPVELLSKMLLFLFSLSYGIGFVIVNSYYGANGVAHPGLFRVEYVSSGLLWLFLFGASIGALVMMKDGYRGLRDSFRKSSGVPAKSLYILLFLLFTLVPYFAFAVILQLSWLCP